MTTGEGIVIATPIAGLFVTIITFIIKRQPKKSPAMEALLESIKVILASHNELLTKMNENMTKIAFQTGRTHGTVAIIEDIVKENKTEVINMKEFTSKTWDKVNKMA